MNLHYYMDPGHGWLAVSRNQLTRLGIEGQITGFSYQKGQTVYLEEDGDMSLFLNALDDIQESYKIISHHTNGRSPIRNYATYGHKGE